jgi:hypothetical protein
MGGDHEWLVGKDLNGYGRSLFQCAKKPPGKIEENHDTSQ